MIERLVYASLDSTSTEARRLVKTSPRSCFTVVSARQTAGRGRYGRDWESPEGNLYATFGVPLSHQPLEETVGLFSLASATAVAEVLEAAGLRPALKWPNDVLVDDRKIAGVLLEVVFGKGQWFLLAGIGVNLQSAPSTSAMAASCVREALGGAADDPAFRPLLFLDRLESCFFSWIPKARKDPKTVRQSWLDRAWRLGEPLRVRLSHQTLEGIFEGIDGKGSLILDIPPRRVLSFGEIFSGFAS